MTIPLVVPEFMPGAGPYDVPGEFYLAITGAATSRASTPDNAAFAVTDLDVRIDVTLDDWIPPSGTNYEIVGQFTVTGNQRAWLLFISPDGELKLRWSTNGTNEADVTSTEPLVPPPSGRMSLRVTHDVNNGAAGKTTRFYTSDSLTGTWTQHGAAVTTAGTTSIHNSTGDFGVGDVPGSGFEPYSGRVHGLDWRSTIGGGTAVANPDFTVQAAGTTSFTDAAGRTWSVGAEAELVGYDWEPFPDSEDENGELRPRLQYLEWDVGRANELDLFTSATATMVLRNNDRVLDPEYTAGPYFGQLLPRVPVRARAFMPALVTPGFPSAAQATTPDHSSYAVTDLDVRVLVAMDDWTPGGFGQIIASQWGSAGNEGWSLAVTPAGNLQLTFTSNGTTDITRTSTAATGFENGSWHWVRYTLDVSDGGNNVARFYTSSDGVMWELLGDAVSNAGATSIFNSTADLVVGDIATPGIFALAGQVRHFQLLNGIDGTPVADANFALVDEGVSAFVDETNRLWSITGAAEIEVTAPVDLFTMYVKSGWAPAYNKPYASTCTIELEDLVGVLANTPLPKSAYDSAVLISQPRAQWKLDEASGTQMADSSGNGFHGIFENGEAADPLVLGGVHSFLSPNGRDSRGIFVGESLPEGPPCTIEAWVRTTRDLGQTKVIANVQRDNANGSGVTLKVENSGGGSPNGELVIDFRGLGTLYKARGHTRIDDDRAHHVVCVITTTSAADIRLYVDGAEEIKTTISGTDGGNWTDHFWWVIGNVADVGAGDFGFDGTLDEVAVYDRALTAAEVADHYEAGTTAFSGHRSGERINYVLDLAKIPESMRDIADGDVILGPADFAGEMAGQYLDRVVENEQGVFYCDHTAGGVLWFMGRYHRVTEERSTMSLATFTDDPDSTGFKYRPDIGVEPNGIDSVVNTVEARWLGGTEVVTNRDSIDRYGPKSRTITTEASTPEVARSAAEWVIGRYAQPQTRVRRLPLGTGGGQRGLALAVLEQRICDRVTVERNPVNIGDPIINDLIVEGIHHEMNPDQSWYSTYSTSNADDVQVWQWGISAWGTTAIWG